MINKKNRAVLLLTAYDPESIQITLRALNNTISEDEKVVIILNGKGDYYSALVERIARDWVATNPQMRKVVRPLSSGQKPFLAIKEILEKYIFLKDVEYICKIDDDIIPLKYGWMDNLAKNYHELKKTHNVGFVTGIINNNNWGFKQLVDIFEKKEEYNEIMNYNSFSPEKILNPGEICDNFCGSVWQYSYLAWWIHHWTSLKPEDYVKKTQNLSVKEIPISTWYSIGCMFFHKNLWLSLNYKENEPPADETLIHKYCLKEKISKWAIMNEPMIHLYYYLQKSPNREIINKVSEALGAFFNDSDFYNIRYLTTEDRLIYMQDYLDKFE